MGSNCYDLLQNPVFELRKRCINQDETGFLLPLPTTIYTVSDLVLSSLHYVIISCPSLCTTSPFCHGTRQIRYTNSQSVSYFPTFNGISASISRLSEIRNEYMFPHCQFHPFWWFFRFKGTRLGFHWSVLFLCDMCCWIHFSRDGYQNGKRIGFFQAWSHSIRHSI